MEEKKEIQQESVVDRMFGIDPNIKRNRAQKRQFILPNGMRALKRPFNNRANTSKRPGVHSRTTNQIKKKIYAQLFGRK